MDSHSGVRLSETARLSYIIDKLWLLTEWHIIFHKVGSKHPSGEVGNSVAVLLHIYFSICVPKIIKIQCGLTKLLKKYLLLLSNVTKTEQVQVLTLAAVAYANLCSLVL